ncbi:MAG: type II toxin-antitoxin system VapC family toxin [Candidatus Methylacidiphilales bacterium]|nr:type II toxin-antitoxin system VapC family toxin [Candidatus Methylacidiphilales bacterium]
MYLDSSVIVKLLVPEGDTDHYAALVEGHDLHSSDLAFTEVFSALCGQERGGHLRPENRKRAWDLFSTWVREGDLTLHAFQPSVFQKAQQMIALCHPPVGIHALDALHLAVCDLHQDFPLVSNDQRMLAAAARLGIPTA